MEKVALLVGNDINNISSGNSWSELLDGLTTYLSIDVDFPHDKPFPLAYEEIFFKTIKHTSYKEDDIKRYVAEHVNRIESSNIHHLICNLGVKNILTTNYDLSLESVNSSAIKDITNKGYIKETKYSLFRKHEQDKTTFWHIHGSSTEPRSITLGYEHYSGYLQNIRNYVVSGTKDTYKNKTFKPLLLRMRDKEVENHSWLDLFFTVDIHIFGLALDFVETELWWLLTYREKTKFLKKSLKSPITNVIHYYIPEEFVATSKTKMDLLNSLGVIVIPIEGYSTNKQNYYESVIASISSQLQIK